MSINAARCLSLWSKLVICISGALSSSPAIAGHDVAISNLPDIGHAGPINGVHAYVVGFTVCNVGTIDLAWVSSTNQHPVEGWSMYRLRDGRFEQIGISWLKHGFFAASGPGCGTCNGHNGSVLGIGCQDTYDVSLNSYQSSLGPRFQVNAASGGFPYPFANPNGSTGGAIFKYCQVQQADLANPGALYFVEGQLVHPQDAPAGNAFNNNSYRRVTIDAGYNAAMAGATVPFEPAIRAWRANGLGAGVVDRNVRETNIDVANDGRFWLASKATHLGGGVWHYEYALFNLNSDLAGRAFTVPLPGDGAVIVTNAGFHDVAYHSGEPFANDDWALIAGATSLRWETQTFAQNPNANALRWGTMYNFRFDCNRPPRNSGGAAALELFKGVGGSVAAPTIVPDFDCNHNNVGDAQDIANGTSVDANVNGTPDECEPPPCPADIAPAGGPPNGAVDTDDLILLIGSWGACGNCAACPADIAPPGGNCQVNTDDMIDLITRWGPCP